MHGEDISYTQWKTISFVYIVLPGIRGERIPKALGLCFYFTHSIKLYSLEMLSERGPMAQTIWETLNVHITYTMCMKDSEKSCIKKSV